MDEIKKDFLMEETGPSHCGFGDFSLVEAPLWGSETLSVCGVAFFPLPACPPFRPTFRPLEWRVVSGRLQGWKHVG